MVTANTAKKKEMLKGTMNQTILHQRIPLELTLEEVGGIPKRKIKSPKLKFSKTAWEKLIYLRDIGDTEVGGYGMCPNPLDPFFIDDILVPKQQCTSVTVEFEEKDLNECWDSVDPNKYEQPYQTSGIWIHTHPGNCALPSHTDEQTFDQHDPQAFFIMFILSKGNTFYARMKLAETLTVFEFDAIEVVDDGLTQERLEELKREWDYEYIQKIEEKKFTSTTTKWYHSDDSEADAWLNSWGGFYNNKEESPYQKWLKDKQEKKHQKKAKKRREKDPDLQNFIRLALEIYRSAKEGDMLGCSDMMANMEWEIEKISHREMQRQLNEDFLTTYNDEGNEDYDDQIFCG